MVRGTYTYIRTSDADDAGALKAIYNSEEPKSSLLDQRREVMSPTLDELRQAMGQGEFGRSAFYTVEDLTGVVRGFCSLRGAGPEPLYSDLLIILRDQLDFEGPLAGEVLDFLLTMAFQRLRMNKVIAHCLDSEGAYRAFLLGHGFRSSGVQREVVFSRGRWYNLEAFGLFRSETRYA